MHMKQRSQETTHSYTRPGVNSGMQPSRIASEPHTNTTNLRSDKVTGVADRLMDERGEEAGKECRGEREEWRGPVAASSPPGSD